MWAMSDFVAGPVASSLNSRMVKSDGTNGLKNKTSSNGVAPEAPRLRAYHEVMNHLLKRYANDGAVDKADVANLLFTVAGMTPLQYGKARFV